jgi:hypothetical protein
LACFFCIAYLSLFFSYIYVLERESY